MKLNQEELKRLSSLSDKRLEEEIRRMAESKGLRLPSASPSHEDLEKLRALLSSENGFGLMDAMRYYNAYKKKYGSK
jgi:regulator of sirC expression with transglutaminase-like and TPR domain